MASGRIKGITIEIDGNTTKLNNALKGVDGQLNKTQKSLRDVDKLLKLKPGNADLLRQKQKQLQASIDQTKQRLDKLREAQSHVDEGSDEWDTIQREIIDTDNKLKALEKEYKRFGSVAAQQVAAAGEKVKGVGTKMADVGQTLTTRVTVPLAAAGALSAKKFADVDKTMQLTTKTMGATAEESKILSDAMKSAAARSVYGMNDAATATLNFARAGLKAEQAAEVLAPAMNLAAGEGGDLDTVSAGLVATLNGFGDPFEKAAGYADVFANACNNSALDINTLADSMKIAAPVFKTAGYSVKDASLYLGIMANAGIDANEGANALKTGIARLVSPSKQAAEAMDDLGISVTKQDGSMKDTITIQKELHDKFSKLSESEQIAAASAIFGKNQMTKWLALINTAPQDVEKLSAALDKEGTTAEMADAMMSGFGGSMEKLKSSVDVAATSLGEALAPTISKVADGIQKAVDWFNSLDASQQQLIAKIGLIVATVGPLLLIGGKLLTGIGMLMTYAPQIVAFGGLVAKGFGLVKAAVAALSFNPVVLGIGAAIAAGVLIYKNWDKIKAKAAELKAAVANKWNELKANTVNRWKNMKTTMSNAAKSAKDNVSKRWSELKSGTAAKWESMKSTVSTKAEGMASAAKKKITSLKTAASNAWNSMKDKASERFGAIKDAIKNKLNGAKDAVSKILKKIADKFPFKVGDIIKFRKPTITLKTGEKTVLGKTIKYPAGFDVTWHAKAYDQPIEFTRPTIVPTMRGAHGFGDRPGSEIVYGRKRLAQDTAAVTKMLGNKVININVYANERQNAREIAAEVKRELIREENKERKAWA